jgi:RsiW-degrading membrane proteinase PrsW (M82 family)
MTQCEHCGRDTPDEPFCTWCGAHRVYAGADARTRRRDYAAHSGEHVSQPSVVTTLFPHLPRHRVHEFRWALLGGLAVVVALVGGGLIVAALLAAAVVVPTLYLVYLYEAQVYRDEPAKVLGLTMAAGVVLGVVVTIIADAILNESSPLKLSPGTGFIVGSCIVLPIIQEAIKPLPVLALRGQGKFSETIDGLTFGVAAGLGYAAAETIVQFSKVIATEPVHTTSANWLFPILGVTILTPLLQGTCTGVIVAVLWKPSRLSNPLYIIGLPIAFGGHVLYSVVAQVLQDNNVNAAIILFFQAAVVGGLLVYIRHLVHSALLEEAKDFGFQVVTCPHCRQTLGAAGFCPECGGAVSAGPRNPAAASAVSAVPDVPVAETPPAGAAGGPVPGGANA